MIQHSSHHFSFEQLQFLNRGPAYVPPCQMHILSKSSLTLAQIITKQMAKLRRDLTRVFTKYPIDLSRRMNFEQKIQEHFNESFLQSIPSSLEERALYEKELIQSIRIELKKNQLILRRTADNMNTYYLGRADNFEKKANDSIQNATSYEFISTIDENHTEQQQINEIMKSFNCQLELFYQKKLINVDFFTKFNMSKNSHFRLPYLYFLPETDENIEMSVQPRFSSHKHSPIYVLANYLTQILQPLYDNLSPGIHFFNSGDFMEKLNYFYFQSKRFQRNTYLATFKIHDLPMMVSHTALLNSLNAFLVNPLILGRHERLSNDAILELTNLVLKHNFFSYNRKIYRFIKGCPTNLSLTKLLINIYLYHWQIPLVRNIRIQDTFYGRYNNIGFFTWNRSIQDCETMFEELQQTLDRHIEMTTFVGSHVNFFDAFLENQDGRLYTRVHHDTTSQPFLLPYSHEHPRLFHRQWFQYALIRAAQYCCQETDFENERIYIALTFLANGYSLDFVESNLKQFFSRFLPSQYHSMRLSPAVYFPMRRELFRYVNEQKTKRNEEKQLEKHHQLIVLHYLYDWGLRNQFNEKFHELWSNILNHDLAFKNYGLKIKLKTKHCYSSNTFLTRSMPNG